jgi:hypothetical protein
LKNSDLGEARNFACPLNCIAHHRHEGIASDAENLAQEPRSAFAPASSVIAPLQIQMDEIKRQAASEFFNSIGEVRPPAAWAEEWPAGR